MSEMKEEGSAQKVVWMNVQFNGVLYEKIGKDICPNLFRPFLKNIVRGIC